MTDYVIEDGEIVFTHTFSDGQEVTVFLVPKSGMSSEEAISAFIERREKIINGNV